MTMDNDMISVIVATYNQETTIRRTLDSILMQQCHLPVEIVIGEDCSTDHTRSICEQYARHHPDHIRLIANERNKGIIDNYFDCLLACRGKYIADCAGDDFWTTPLKLEKEVCIMESHPEVTLVHTNWVRYDEVTGNTSPSGRQPFDQLLTDGHSMLQAIVTPTARPIIHLCTALYRADFVKTALSEDPYLFRNKEFGCEDLQICFEAARRGVIAYLPDITLNYSVNHTSVSFNTDDTRQFQFVRRITDLSHYLIRKHQLRGTELDNYFQQRIFTLAMHAFRAHSNELRDEVHMCADRWNVKPTGRTTAVESIMQNDILWQAALALRKIIVVGKHIAR